MKYALVVSEFNEMITMPMLTECLRGFEEQGIPPIVKKVPGALEIPIITQDLILKFSPNAIVVIGVIVKGETDHYKAICEMCSQGIMDLTLKHHVPIVFEVLMVDSYKKAEERIEKAYNAAFVATRMVTELNSSDQS